MLLQLQAHGTEATVGGGGWMRREACGVGFDGGEHLMPGEAHAGSGRGGQTPWEDSEGKPRESPATHKAGVASPIRGKAGQWHERVAAGRWHRRTS